jgi:nucleoid-associated protein YgaU
MIRNTRVRTAAAAAALATSVAIAVTATGAARADNSTPQPAADGAPAAASDAGPPRAVAFAARDPLRGATHYVVTAGDSYWAIAEDVLPDGAATSEVLRVADELISLNMSKLGYDVPTMLHPGDVVDVPSQPAADRPAAPSVSAATPSHHVVAGDSYWAIAESVLGADAAPADVLAKTEQLIELNRARLGYDDPQMLHPGDVVYVDPPAAKPEEPVEAEAPDAPEGAMTPDAGEVEMPAVPLTEKVKDEPKAGSEGQTQPDRQPTRAETPDSPPLSELAIIATSRHSAEATGWAHSNAIAD